MGISALADPFAGTDADTDCIDVLAFAKSLSFEVGRFAFCIIEAACAGFDTAGAVAFGAFVETLLAFDGETSACLPLLVLGTLFVLSETLIGKLASLMDMTGAFSAYTGVDAANRAKTNNFKNIFCFLLNINCPLIIPYAVIITYIINLKS